MKHFLFYIIIPLSLFGQSDDQVKLANEYYFNGDLTKAGDIYSKLANDRKNISSIHTNYFNILLSLKEYKKAEKYLKKIRKIYPSNVYYQIDEGILYQTMGNTDLAHKKFNELIDRSKKNQYLVRTAAQYFISKEMADYALMTYQSGRKNTKDKSIYALEMANTYRILGDKSSMINEYLTFASLRPNNLRYVKNILQNLLREAEEIESFQEILIENIQKHPNEKMYSELLIWVNLQQKDFYGAYLQARALDKRFKGNGSRIMDIGKIALVNQSYDDAIEIFQYLIDNYRGEVNYIHARRTIIKAREEKVKNRFPVDQDAIRQLTYDYKNLLRDIGINHQTLEAYRSKALLHAFFLDEKDSAVLILNQIITMPRVNAQLRAKSKLDLGDIYLLIGELWESTLLYSQVEKTNKDSKIGYEAKLKNARLNYYKGNFELAKSHLDILKLATTREIANDAIALSLLIQENTVLDTSDFVMKEYANIELLEFHNKKNEALQAYTLMAAKYPTHSLIDEIYWKQANLNLELGYFEKSLENLHKIQTMHGDNILGDDAMFLSGKIHEQHLGNVQQAMDIYNEFLLKYPGSVFTAEARKRFRQLRGDNIF